MRAVLTLLALGLCLHPAAADGWEEVFAARRDSSLAWRQARLSLRAAELDLDRFLKPYLPSLSVGTAAGTAAGVEDGGFTGATVKAALTCSGLFGADLSLAVPVKAAPSGGIGLGDPTLSLTRRLFVEDDADRLQAEAALLRARAALRDAENAARLQLMTDILNAVYYRRLLEANRGDLAVLERVKTATVKAASLREVERRILQAGKAILSASHALAALDAAVRDRADALYEELLVLAASWTAAVPETDPVDSAAIRAQELECAAAEKRRAFPILPYLPNPSLTAGLSYDVDGAAFHWGLTLQFSAVVLDKGERELAALRRLENADLERIRLDAAKKSLGDTVRQARGSLAVLELDRRIQDLDIADAKDNAARLKALYEGGYISEEDLVVGRIDLSIEELDALKIDNDVLIQKMKLVQAFPVE